jgi:hypothetical protein
MSDREIAQRLYTQSRNNTPSTFDVVGAFNNYYNKTGKEQSFSVPLDFSKAVPASSRANLVQSFNKSTGSYTTYNSKVTNLPEEGRGFWTKAGEKLEQGYNLAAQAVVFGLALPEDNNPIWNGAINLDRIQNSWTAARDISPGQALVANNPFTNAISALQKLPGGLGDKFIDDHLLFASNDFDLYDSADRRKAFTEQTTGRISSWTTDVVARFVIDPGIFVGKAYKGYKAAKYGLESLEQFKGIVAGNVTGRKAERIKNTFNDFLERTDGLANQDLFRIKAIRESSNPGVLADLITQANKIEDKSARHLAKTNVIHMAMGDADAFSALVNQNEILAAKVASLQDEIPDAKYLSGKTERFNKNSQLTFDYLNDGAEYEKSLILIKELEGQIDEVYKRISAVGIMDPKKVPFVDTGSDFRKAFVNSQNFIDMRTGITGVPVRFHTGFFYKRPRGWVDYTDNQSIQTIDNQLSRVVGINNRQVNSYNKELSTLKSKLALGGLDDATKKSVIQDIKRAEDDLKKATFTVERRSALFDKYATAANADARALAHAEIEEELFSTVAKQFGYDEADVRRAYSAFANSRQKTVNLIKERAYTGARDPLTGGPVGARVKPIVDEEGLQHLFPLPAPILETQLVKQMPTLDIDTMYKVLKRYHAAEQLTPNGKVYKAYTGAMKLKNGTGDIVDGLDQFLKFQVLARLGYPVRNLTEGNLRVFSLVGGMAIMSGLAVGSKNLTRATYERLFGKNAARTLLEMSEKTQLEATRIQLLAARQLADEPLSIDAQISEIDQILAGKRKPSDQYGMGQIKIFGLTLEDAKGLTPEQAAYYNEKFIASSSQIVDANLTRARDSLSNAIQSTGDFVTIRGSEAGWSDAYLRVVNQQIKGSEIGRMFLKGASVDDVEMFLASSPAGRRIFKSLGMGRTPRELAEANAENMRHLFPEWTQGRLLAIAKERKLTADDIKKHLGTDAARYPDVNGAQVADVIGGNFITKISSDLANKFYQAAGEMPESALVKSPLYVNLYRRRLNALVERAIETTPGDTVDPRYLRSLEGKARQWARSEMRRTVYDITEKTDAAHTLKYAFPFFGAFSDVAEKWTRLAINDPSIVRKLQTTFESPDRMGLTEERDGVTYINMPGEWTKRMGIDRPLAIPKPSLNLIFQGGAWWNPGAGWFVQSLASQVVSKYSDLEKMKIVEEILPYGAQDRTIKDLVVQAAWARKALAIMSEEDPMRTRLTALIAAEENAKYDQGLRDTAPTRKEINDRAIKTLGMEVAARLILPFATNARSPYQFYIDEFHRLREEDANTASEKFYDMYGDDYYNFTISLSKNNTGISATISADKRSKELADLIAQNPEYGWFLVGDANSGEFSPTIYGNQFEESVAPGSTVKFRETDDPYEALEAVQAEKGWKVYRQGMAIIEARRIEGGFKSLNSRGAERLKAQKAAFIESLTTENSSWGSEFGKIDTQKVNNFLRYATNVIQDSRLSGRQDIQTLSDYLEGRRFIMQELANRESKSIDNEDNLDIKERWDTFVGRLLDEDVTFERIYTRILERDDLRKGF